MSISDASRWELVWIHSYISKHDDIMTWEIFSTLLTLCDGNPPVTLYRRVTGSTDSLWYLLCPTRDKGRALIARFMGPTWGPSGADRTQVGPMLAHELCYLGSHLFVSPLICLSYFWGFFTFSYKLLIRLTWNLVDELTMGLLRFRNNLDMLSWILPIS